MLSNKLALKLNVLLAKTEHAASQYKKLIGDYLVFFKSKQGEFKGVKKTYTVREGIIDEPSMRGTVKVVTTVGEKLEWLEENTAEYIDNLFAVESTNASLVAKSSLIVNGLNFGELTSLELLRLKSLLEAGDLEKMYAELPVRSDAEEWNDTTEEMYQNRKVSESPKLSGVKKSVMKEAYILKDPNVDNLKDMSRYTPQVQTKDTIIELGDYTVQHFSGETTHLDRANILKRRSQLLNATIEALKKANDVEIVPSAFTAAKLFGFLHRGKI